MMSNRTVDHNGFMTIENCILTSEAVDDYLGDEIPQYQALGLDPSQTYGVYRPLEEIEKAKDEWDNKQLLLKHVRTTADDTKKNLQVGVVGNDATVADGKLYNTVVIHDGDAIDNLDNIRDLSIGYDYTPVLESGTFDGKPYQVKMTNIKGNHLALVDEGRNEAAIVADAKSNLTKKGDMNFMSKTALLTTFIKRIVGDKRTTKLTGDEAVDLIEKGATPEDIKEINKALDKEETVADEPIEEKTAEADENIDKQILAKLDELISALKPKTTGDEDDEAVGDEDDDTTDDEADEEEKKKDDKPVGDRAISLAKRLGGKGKVVGDRRSANKYIASALSDMGYNTKGKASAELHGMAEVAVKHIPSGVSYSVTGDSKKSSIADDLAKMGF